MLRSNSKMAGKEILRRERGFSLIELLVGIMVAILASSAIMVSFSVFDNRKRTTQSGSDAQVNGAYALQMLEREIRMGGYSYAASIYQDAAIGCVLSGGFSNFPPAVAPVPVGTLAVPPGAAIMAPVLIVDDANNQGAGGSDVIRVMYGDSASVVPFEPSGTTGPSVAMNAGGQGVSTGDTVLFYNSESPTRGCALRRVTTAGAALGFAPDADPNRYNNAGLSPDIATDTMFLLGNFRVMTFSTIPLAGANGAGRQAANALYVYEANTGGRNRVVAPLPPDPRVPPGLRQVELSPDIVNIQAQYGLDLTNNDNKTIISQWRDATAANAWDQASILNRMLNTPSPAKSPLTEVKAVRLAVVARSALLEQRRVAGTCNAPGVDQDMGGATLRVNGLLEFNWPDGTLGRANVQVADINNWGCYRYQVSQTVIPLRNVIWSFVK